MEKNAVLIVGFGHIGKSTMKYLKDLDIWVKDKEDVFTNVKTGQEEKDIKKVNAKYWIICVPGETDGEKDGETEKNIDTTLVEKYIDLAKKYGAEPIVRTTLPLGYRDDFKTPVDFTYWPSFVTDYDNDEQRLVMSSRGYDNGFCKYITDGIMFLSLHDTIVAKLFSNAYLALRAEFFNKVADYSENVPAVINAICADRRIGNFYNYAERKRWGGKCFVKDMNDLAKYDKFMDEVNKSNKRRGE